MTSEPTIDQIYTWIGSLSNDAWDAIEGYSFSVARRFMALDIEPHDVTLEMARAMAITVRGEPE